MGFGDIFNFLLIEPMTNVLVAVAQVFGGNFGISIIIFTLVMRAITWPLTASQYKQSKRMQEMQPKMQELQKKYKGKDPKKLQQETMALYKEAGVNPIGCIFPMLVQFPIWIALYQVINKTLGETFYVMIFFNLLFSSVIAMGVVYNAARVSLSERSRELASLRVLGFTRGEISFILLGELAVVTVMAIPVGMLLGYSFAGLLVAAFNTELYRFPLVVSTRTFAYAATSVLVAATISGFAVRSRLDHLDLVAVLKTRE